MNFVNFDIVKEPAPSTDWRVFGDAIRTSEAKDIAELGAVMAVYGGKAVAAGVTAAMSAALAFLTMPFKGTGVNALKVGK